MKHKHYDLIMAWANGAEIEYQTPFGDWFNAKPEWDEKLEYRVKPKPNKELLVTIDFELVQQEPSIASVFLHHDSEHNKKPNVKFSFDGETGEFLKVEKI